MTDTPTLLRIENLAVRFDTPGGPVNALKGVSLSVCPGEIVAVVGESGSGKSVTALSILGLLPPKTAQVSGGRIFLHQNETSAIDLVQATAAELSSIRGHRISMIFQEPMTSLNPVMTCGAQVAEVLRKHLGMPRLSARLRTIELFERVRLPEPSSIFDRYPHQLSGGQKQRVMIAMAMSCNPDLLIADEPTTALDVTVQQTILSLIRELQAETGMGVLFITHDLGLVADLADKIVVMYRGEIVESGPTNDILQTPSHPYTRALLACRPALHLPGNRLPVVADFLDDPNVSSRRQAASVMTEPPPNRPKTGSASELFLEVRNLRVSFPGADRHHRVMAVDGVDFDVVRGEILGLVGESGCGKTTLGRALLGLMPADAGRILHEGRDLLTLNGPAWKEMRRSLQIVFQDPYGSLNPRMRIGDAIAEPLLVHGLFPRAAERRSKVDALLEKVGLQPAHYDRYPHEFSGGQRQRIGIARALALHPTFLVLDESVSALDVSVQAQILNLLADLRREFGFTALFISHDLSVVRHVCDRILVMRKGRIIESGRADDVFNRPADAYTRALLAAIPGGGKSEVSARK